MASDDFEKKLKRNVAENFNQSYQIYHAFEAKHRLFETLALALATFIELPERSDVLDVGCGNGISARALNDKYGCRVLGVDLSEKMVAAGRSLCKTDDIRLEVGDGERLSSIVGLRRFDCVVYNASIFIFPNASRSIREAAACLKPGGAIAFSYYPDIQDDAGEDLIPRLFERIGQPIPKFRVIAGYRQICQAIERYCGPLRQHRWHLPLDADFLIDFFSIPAQSASLFPGHDFNARQALVHRLFADLQAVAKKGRIVWRLAGAQKEK
jgi:SAM-dependent methyltransferase